MVLFVRRGMCVLILAGLAGGIGLIHRSAAGQEAAVSAVKETGEMKAARKHAAHRTRRIIMNNDGNDARGVKGGEQKTPEAFLARRTSPLAGSQVDAIFYCSGVFNFYTHKSEETELRGHGDKRQLDWAWELTQQGTDSLTLVTNFGHAHGMEVFWSMRMNDTHDSGDDSLLCQWKQAHPEYLMGTRASKYKHGGGRWSAVNYGLPEVRDKVFRILKDVASRYDVDGLELDFYRHPVYFKPQMTGKPVTQEDCNLMTELLRRVRAMTVEIAEQRTRPVLIAVRVPDSLGFAKGVGLDVERWLQEDLVDIVTGGGYFQFEPWEHLVALGKKYDVPVYAGLSGSRIRADKEGADDASLWHEQAALAWHAGVNGIYVFNRFNPKDPLFWSLGNPETLNKPDHEVKPVAGEKRAMERWLKGGSRFSRIGD
ncbi:MAG TPA: family 10 glycosylhydrolase [Candidatus Hydrogenedentes bacterium]|nr:family 10 glycosylhydrolase [Candidatus Hydrogenedentota bacterium]